MSSESHDAPAAPVDDPMALMRSRAYVKALILAAIIGVPVSAIAYGFLALVDWTQEYLFTELPGDLGLGSTPWWWPLPLLALSGLLVALSISRLPGTSGHSPALGFQAGGGATAPADIPGIVLAAFATLALGAVLGPEAPLIALGSGLGAFAILRIQKGAPPNAVLLMATAGSFAAVSTLLGNPLVGAFLLLEAAGIAGAMLGVVLLPGLLAAGVGSLIFTGLNSLTGLGTFSLQIPNLPGFTTPTVALIGWAVVFGLVCPLIAWVIYSIARSLRPLVHARRIPVSIVLGLLVAGCAIAFDALTDQGIDQVLFSGQSALPGLVSNPGAWTAGALALVILFKGIAYALSLSAFRGGPVFPSMFIGGALGVLAMNLPGMELVPAVAMGIGAMCVSMLRLPFTSVLLATLLMSSSGIAAMPLVIVAVVVAHVAMASLPAPRENLFGRSMPEPAAAPSGG
jgi:H+/Cl- antiporter ClcA